MTMGLRFCFLISLLFVVKIAVADYPLCPLTGVAPAPPTINFTRCLGANVASCCNTCDDLGQELAIQSINGTEMLSLLSPSLVALLSFTIGKDFQMCNVVSGSVPCQNQIEQFVCGLKCDPNAGNYLTVTGRTTGTPQSTVRVCQTAADFVFKVCGNVSIPGLPGAIGDFLNTPDQLLKLIFGSFAKYSGVPNLVITIVPDGSSCYAGPVAADQPAVPNCCDPVTIPSYCPASAVNLTTHPRYESYIGRKIVAKDCALPPPPPAVAAAPVYSAPPPPVTYPPPPPKSGGKLSVASILWAAVIATAVSLVAL